MAVSVFDLFKIGIGPSSSHTVGPMRAARMFVSRLALEGMMVQTARVKVELFGSLGATGKGHDIDKAMLLGLAGHEPDTVDVDAVPTMPVRRQRAVAAARRARDPHLRRHGGGEELGQAAAGAVSGVGDGKVVNERGWPCVQPSLHFVTGTWRLTP